MHLLIPFAATLSPVGTQALKTLDLPRLGALLARLEAGPPTGGDEYSLTPPHERAHAEAIGLRGEDGLLAWGAIAAGADGIDVGDTAWGLLTPVHWNVGRDNVTLADPDALQLDEASSRAAFEAIRPLFEDEGFALAWGAPTRWYASHAMLEGLPTASLDRAIGRSVDLWLGDAPAGRFLRRLQAEVQMTLYTHALNDERESRGELPINSFWLSGCGRLQPVDEPRSLVVDRRLRSPVLNEDWASWMEAWKALDAGPIAELLDRSQKGEAVSLTLCGERFAQRFDAARRSLWQRMAGSLQRAPSPLPMLEAL